MPLPSGFDPTPYRDVPMAFAGPVSRRAFRRLQQKSWAGLDTARIAIAGDSIMLTEHISRLNRICGQIYGNTPETQWFGTATGTKPSPAAWDWRVVDQSFLMGSWTWKSDVVPDPSVLPWPIMSTGSEPDLSVDSDWAAVVRAHALNGAPVRSSHYGEPAYWCDLSEGITADIAVWGPVGDPGNDIRLETHHRLRSGNHGSADDFGSAQQDIIPAAAPEGATVYSVSSNLATDSIGGWSFDQARHYQLMLESRMYLRPLEGDDPQDLKLARLGVRHRFSNPLGMVFHHFSIGGKRLDEWLTDNSTAMPLWYEPLGPFDCVIQTHAVNTGGTPSHDDFYDDLHAFVDLWKSINPDILIWLCPPHYTRRSISGMSDEDAREWKEKVASIFHLVATERDCLFFNTPRWLHERFGFYHETQTRDLPDAFDPQQSYDRGDLVRVDHDESTDAPESPEARGRRGHYICIEPVSGPIGPDDWPGNQRHWMRIDYAGWDNVHVGERIEEERYRLLAGLLAGTAGGPQMQRSLGAGDPVHRVLGAV